MRLDKFKNKFEIKVVIMVLFIIALIGIINFAVSAVPQNNTSRLPVNLMDPANIKFDIQRVPSTDLEVNESLNINYEITPKPLHSGAEIVFVVDVACPSYHSDYKNKFLNGLTELGKLIKQYTLQDKTRIALVVYYNDIATVVNPEDLKKKFVNNDGSQLFNEWNNGSHINDWRHDLGKGLNLAYNYLINDSNRIFDTYKNDKFPAKHIIATTAFEAKGEQEGKPNQYGINSHEGMEYVDFMLKSMYKDFSQNIYTHILTSEKDFGNHGSIIANLYDAITSKYMDKNETIKVQDSVSVDTAPLWIDAIKSIIKLNTGDSFSIKNVKFSENYGESFTANSSNLNSVVIEGNKVEGYLSDINFIINSEGVYTGEEQNFIIALTPKTQGVLSIPSKLISSSLTFKNIDGSKEFKKYLTPTSFSVDNINFIASRTLSGTGALINNEFTVNYSFKPYVNKVDNLNSLITEGNDIVFVVDNGITIPPDQYSYVKELINFISKSTNNRVRIITASSINNSSDDTILYNSVDEFMLKSYRNVGKYFKIVNGLNKAVDVLENSANDKYKNKSIFVLTSMESEATSVPNADVYGGLSNAIKRMDPNYFLNFLVSDSQEKWPNQSWTDNVYKLLLKDVYNPTHPGADVALMQVNTITDLEDKFFGYFKQSTVYFNAVNNSNVTLPGNTLTLKNINFNEILPSDVSFVKSSGIQISPSSDGLKISGALPNINLSVNTENVYEGNEIKFSVSFISNSEANKEVNFPYGNSLVTVADLLSGTSSISLNKPAYFNELDVIFQENQYNKIRMDLRKDTTIPISEIKVNTDFNMKYTISPRDIHPSLIFPDYLYDSNVIFVVQNTDSYLSTTNRDKFVNNVIHAFDLVANSGLLNNIKVITAGATTTTISDAMDYANFRTKALSGYFNNSTSSNPYLAGDAAKKAYELLKADTSDKRKFVIVVGKDQGLKKSDSQINKLGEVAASINSTDMIFQLIDLDSNNGTTKYFQSALNKVPNYDKSRLIVSSLKGDKHNFQNLYTKLNLSINLPSYMEVNLKNFIFQGEQPSDVAITNTNVKLDGNVVPYNNNKIPLPSLKCTLNNGMYKVTPMIVTVPMKLTKEVKYIFKDAGIKIDQDPMMLFPELIIDLQKKSELKKAGLYLHNNPKILHGNTSGNNMYEVTIAKNIGYEIGALFKTSGSLAVNFISNSFNVKINGGAEVVNLSNVDANVLVKQKILSTQAGEYTIDIKVSDSIVGTLKIIVKDMPNVQ
ncbi:hypothetical protein [Clostridium sp.]|uniref:hypothetical protein n=1 Tax=Clostridium sp. TaxID=1506 RepID=UPI002FC64F40